MTEPQSVVESEEEELLEKSEVPPTEVDLDELKSKITRKLK